MRLLRLLVSAALLRLCSAYCGVGLALVGACNAAPDTTANLQTLFQLQSTDGQGECEAEYAPENDQLYQLAGVVYTGIDGSTTSTTAINTVQDNYPAIDGIYTFDFNVPHTNILAGSWVTWYLTYSIPAAPDFATLSAVFQENHSPSVIYTVATSTLTYPYQVFTETTSTSTITSTVTVTPAAVTSEVFTATVTAKAKKTTTTTTTITPTPRTVYKTSVTKVTTTLTCLPRSEPHRRIKGRQQQQQQQQRPRQAEVIYSQPWCAAVTTTTLATSTTFALQPSTTTVTETDTTTTTATISTTLVAPVIYVSVGETVTSTRTVTSRKTLARTTVTSVISLTDTVTVVPKHPPLTQCGSPTGGSQAMPMALITTAAPLPSSRLH